MLAFLSLVYLSQSLITVVSRVNCLLEKWIKLVSTLSGGERAKNLMKMFELNQILCKLLIQPREVRGLFNLRLISGYL